MADYDFQESVAKTLIVVLAVPFSLVGAVWLLWALDYNVSIAVWVGVIDLMGLDAETGVFMLLFLDLAYDEAKKKRRPPRGGTARPRENTGGVAWITPSGGILDRKGPLPALHDAGGHEDVGSMARANTGRSHRVMSASTPAAARVISVTSRKNCACGIVPHRAPSDPEK